MRYQIINERKRAMNLTNAQLAERAGVTLSTLDKITSGANDNPKLATLQAIARVIGCTLDDFDDVHSCTPSDRAMELAHKFDSLDAHGQKIVLTVLDLEAERCADALSGLIARQKEAIEQMRADESTSANEA